MRTTIRIISDSQKNTFKVGTAIGCNVKPGDLICLIGDLGTGKTVLAKGIAKGMDIDDNVNSPSYTLINEYYGRIPLYHFDVYRLDRPEDAYDIGLDEYIFGDGVTVIEWADRIAELLPSDRLEININKIHKENSREILITGNSSAIENLERELKRDENISIG
ncbi:MAG: tRNA (adenosine(37)-N6)-threonylcarbamoyltransferase complex ATPase subunit type 1 TsaE [Clostridia bacterium]|nr:tRNA (adenosine(37)-N6)-threonylcarbamoyltransferase complex ATPase subunit type 1 TsaE [Clostridia bacterium]